MLPNIACLPLYLYNITEQIELSAATDKSHKWFHNIASTLMATDIQIGDRLTYDGAVCTVRYIGEVSGSPKQLKYN